MNKILWHLKFKDYKCLSTSICLILVQCWKVSLGSIFWDKWENKLHIALSSLIGWILVHINKTQIVENGSNSQQWKQIALFILRIYHNWTKCLTDRTLHKWNNETSTVQGIGQELIFIKVIHRNTYMIWIPNPWFKFAPYTSSLGCGLTKWLKIKKMIKNYYVPIWLNRLCDRLFKHLG